MKRLLLLLLLVMSAVVVGAQEDEGVVITAENAITLTEIAHIPLSIDPSGTFQGTREVAFSPDGTTIAVGALDGTVKLVDIQAGTEIASLEGLSPNILDINFHPNGQILLGASPDKIAFFDLTAEDGSPEITSTYYSAIEPDPDGDQLAILPNFNDPALYIIPFDPETRMLTFSDRIATPIETTPEAVTYSTDGSRIATTSTYREGDNHIITILDAETGDIITTIDPQDAVGMSVALNEDGSIVYATSNFSDDAYVGAWNVDTGEEIFLHSAADVQCGILVNDVFVVCRNDAQLTLYNAVDGTEITTIEVAFTSGTTTDLQIYDAAVSPDGTQIALAQAHENELVILGIGDD